jgi:hypothetical protein
MVPAHPTAKSLILVLLLPMMASVNVQLSFKGKNVIQENQRCLQRPLGHARMGATVMENVRMANVFAEQDLQEMTVESNSAKITVILMEDASMEHVNVMRNTVVDFVS